MTNWKDRWLNFFQLIADPWVIILAAGTVALSIQITRQTNPDMITTYTFIVSAASGILGGVLAKRWDDVIEEKVLTARGKSATRDLKLLLRSIADVEARVRTYIGKYSTAHPDIQSETDLVLHYLEEIVERCGILEEQVINATENWIDVVPEVANLSTKIGVITDLRIKVDELGTSLASVTQELESTKNQSDAEKAALREQRRELEKELRETREELRSTARSSGIVPSGGTAYGSMSMFLTHPSPRVWEEQSGFETLRSIDVRADYPTLQENFPTELMQEVEEESD